MNYYESEQAVIGALIEIGDMSLNALQQSLVL